VTAALTGATGYVGRFIAERLLAEGAPVRAWRRPTSDLTGLPDGVEWVDGDLNSPAAAAALVRGADLLVHAALDHVAGRYRDGEGADVAENLRTNVGGGLALLSRARDAGVRRCVVLSSRAVFGQTSAAPLGDDAGPRPDTLYGASKAALEEFVRVWGIKGWAVTALRPTGVYGNIVPIARSKWFELVGKILRGETIAARIGSEVHGRDVADAVWRLANAPADKIAGKCFNCSDIVVSTRDIALLVHRQAGISGPLPGAGEPPVNVMDSPGLRALGVSFGGRLLFEATIAELVAAIRASVARNGFSHRLGASSF
jgi:nucleoside-diphosphate-sugar epimerase